MNNQETTELSELHEKMELGLALARLEKDKDFELVIKNAIIMETLVNGSRGLLTLDPAGRQEALEKIMSVNYIRDMLMNIHTDAAEAQMTLEGFGNE